MAKRLLLFLLFALGAISAFGQEVVVFSDHRSLVVSSHRQSGNWTYLAIAGGEIAVPTARIVNIHAEEISAITLPAVQETALSADEKSRGTSPGDPIGQTNMEADSPQAASPPPPPLFGQPVLERPKSLQAVRSKGAPPGRGLKHAR